jgi:F0F1-type ATP synthase membrane subunit b/b'
VSINEYIPFVIEHPKAVLSLIIGLALLLFVFYKFNIIYLSYPYWKTLLTERTARIETNHNQVEQALAEAKRLRDDYATRLKGIEVEQRERIAAAVKEAQTSHTEIIADAEQAAAAIRRRTEEEIARERTRQRIQLRREIVQTTFEAAETAVKANSTDSVQHQLIGDFVARAAGDGRPATAATPTAPAPVAPTA